MKVIIPLAADKLGGEAVTVDAGFNVRGHRGRAAIIEFYDRSEQVTWFEEFELLYAQQQHEPDVFKVIRKATEEDVKEFRIPLWIQGEEIPECCGRLMHFVGQIDDDRLCGEPPADAKVWWHDVASFYVFTCSQCLECKAVGQQF